MHGTYQIGEMNMAGVGQREVAILRAPDGKVLLNSDGKTTRRFPTKEVAQFYADTTRPGQGYLAETFIY